MAVALVLFIASPSGLPRRKIGREEEEEEKASAKVASHAICPRRQYTTTSSAACTTRSPIFECRSSKVDGVDFPRRTLLKSACGGCPPALTETHFMLVRDLPNTVI